MSVIAGEHAERRAFSRELVELRVPAAEIVLPAGIGRDHLDIAHRERRPPGAHCAEATALGLGGLEQRQVDLDVEHLLHAPHVRPSPGLVRIDERARHAQAGPGIDDLLAVDGAVAALDLVLGPERESDLRCSLTHMPIVFLW